VPTRVAVARVAVRSSLHHERTDEVGAADESLASVHRDRDGLTPPERLGAAFRQEGRTARHALALACSLANTLGEQHVDRGFPALPTMLPALG